MGLTIPEGATVIWTDPPQLLHDGTLTDLTDEQRVEAGEPPKAQKNVLETLEELIEASEEILEQLEEDPGSEELQAHMEAITTSINELVRLVPGSDTVLRAFGIDLDDE